MENDDWLHDTLIKGMKEKKKGERWFVIWGRDTRSYKLLGRERSKKGAWLADTAETDIDGRRQREGKKRKFVIWEMGTRS